MNSTIHKRTGLKLIIILLFLIFQAGNTFSENLRTLVNLKGYWKFSIGDDPNWAIPNYDDSNWVKVFVPETWEKNGFENYNGFAWYRKHFQIELTYKHKFLYLNLGYIDDVDEVFLNGKKIGASGTFPPYTKVAYDIPRMYPIPVNLLNPDGDNVLSVRIFDDFNEGGIIRGDVGIVEDQNSKNLDVDLSGYWNFEASHDLDKGNYDCITQKKGQIFVPGFWEARGYNGMDGLAIYRKKFRYPSNISTSNMVLLLGVIDDKDVVYLNGEKIVSVDKLERRRSRYSYGSDHLTSRVYLIPDNLLRKSELNEIEVEVEDFSGPGGIYKGPIGIMSRDKARFIIERAYQDKRSAFEKILDYLLD